MLYFISLSNDFILLFRMSQAFVRTADKGFVEHLLDAAIYLYLVSLLCIFGIQYNIGND